MKISPYAAPGMIRRKPMTIEAIDYTVCKFYGQSMKDVHSASRKKELVLCRYVIIHLAAEYLQMGGSALGRYLGIDHSTVQYARKAIQDRIDTDECIARQVADIRTRLNLLFMGL